MTELSVFGILLSAQQVVLKLNVNVHRATVAKRKKKLKFYPSESPSLCYIKTEVK